MPAALAARYSPASRSPAVARQLGEEEASTLFQKFVFAVVDGQL